MRNNIGAVVIGSVFVIGVYAMKAPCVFSCEPPQQTKSFEDTNSVKIGFQGRISPADFQDKIQTGEYEVLDIRTKEEYLAQRITEDPLLIDYYGLEFKQNLAELDKDKKYLIYCRSGNRTSRTVSVMEELGFTNFYELEGGINVWNRAQKDTFEGIAAVEEEKIYVNN